MKGKWVVAILLLLSLAAPASAAAPSLMLAHGQNRDVSWQFRVFAKGHGKDRSLCVSDKELLRHGLPIGTTLNSCMSATQLERDGGIYTSSQRAGGRGTYAAWVAWAFVTPQARTVVIETQPDTTASGVDNAPLQQLRLTAHALPRFHVDMRLAWIVRRRELAPHGGPTFEGAWAYDSKGAIVATDCGYCPGVNPHAADH